MPSIAEFTDAVHAAAGSNYGAVNVGAGARARRAARRFAGGFDYRSERRPLNLQWRFYDRPAATTWGRPCAAGPVPGRSPSSTRATGPWWTCARVLPHPSPRTSRASPACALSGCAEGA